MNSKSSKTRSIMMLLAGSLLWGFSMGSWLAPLAAWIGPVFVMRYSRDRKGWRGYAILFAASILATSIGFIGIWLGGLPRPLVPFLAVGIGFLWSLPYLADRLISPRLNGFSSTFVYPLAATTLEFLFIHTNPLGTWGATGFTQYGVMPLMQLASVTGMIGITFLMGWFASVANWAWEVRERSDEVLRGMGTFGAVLAVVFIFGTLRLNLSPTTDTDETVRVAGVTAQSLQSLFERLNEMSDPNLTSPAARQEMQSYWDAYFEATTREAQAGAKVILWPELAGTTTLSDEASYVAQAQEVARQNGIYLAIPFNVIDADTETWPRLENKLLLFDPSGTLAFEHIKYGGAIIESSRVGDGKLLAADTPFGLLSGVICWDMDYPAIIQQSGQNGTGLMLVPSSDWIDIDPIHAQMAVFRAIENGMSVVRQTRGGLSIAVDAYGRVLAQTDFFGATDRTMVAQVPTKHVGTLYTAFGRYFEWLFVAGFLVVTGRALIVRRPYLAKAG
jgi:apolipoprotein N-acyltransferase